MRIYKTHILLILLFTCELFGKNILVMVDSYSKVNSNKIENIFNSLQDDDKLTAMVVYNDTKRSKVYINSLKKEDKQFNVFVDKFLFRIDNLDIPINKRYGKVTIKYNKTIQVAEEQIITFDKSDTLFAIDDSGSMNPYVNDVARDIRNVASQIDFNNSKFGMLICPGKNIRSDGFTNDKSKINKYLNHKEMDKKTYTGRELPCALKTSVDMFSKESTNKNRLMFYFGDGVSPEDLESVKELKKLGVVIVPIAVGDMNKATLSNISTSGKILRSTNINLKTLQTVTRKVMVNKLVVDTKEITVPIDEHKLFNSLSNVNFAKYDKVYLMSDMTHNANGINYKKELEEVGEKKANKLIEKEYGINLNKMIRLMDE